MRKRSKSISEPSIECIRCLIGFSSWKSADQRIHTHSSQWHSNSISNRQLHKHILISRINLLETFSTRVWLRFDSISDSGVDDEEVKRKTLGICTYEKCPITIAWPQWKARNINIRQLIIHKQVINEKVEDSLHFKTSFFAFIDCLSARWSTDSKYACEYDGHWLARY